MLPSWVRRRPLISATLAGVLVATLIAGYILTAPFSPPGSRYASVPGQPCALVGAADLAKYLPGAALSSYPRGPEYARSQHACTLIRASTLARYGVGGAATAYPGDPQDSICFWNSDSLSIFANVTIDSDPDNAQGAFQFDLQDARTNQGDGTFRGAKPEGGLGQQAEAIFQTRSGSPSVDLYVWSGNAIVEIGADSLGPPLSRADLLAADVAMARDALASLRRG